MGTRTALELITEYCNLRGLPTPAALVGSSDKSTAQLKVVLQQTVRKLLALRWETQKVSIALTAVAANNQGALTTLFPGYAGLVADAAWATSRKIPIIGPIPDAEWATQNALSLVGPPYKYWLGEGNLQITPVPTAGDTLTFYYYTRYGYSASGVPQENLTEDGNLVLFPDEAVLAGIEAYWLKQKGMPYETEMNEFLGIIAREKARDGAPKLGLGASSANVQPRIYIPVGNWLTGS